MKDLLVMKIFLARNNYSFLARFMATVAESLEKAVKTPEDHFEFQAYGSKENYVKSVLEGHHEKLNFAGILLTYASFEETFLFDIKDFGKACGCNLTLSDLSGSFVERCKKYIHKLCKVEPKELKIDWESIADFATIRNFIVHSNGNLRVRQKRLDATRNQFGNAFQSAWSAETKGKEYIQSVWFLYAAVLFGATASSYIIWV